MNLSFDTNDTPEPVVHQTSWLNQQEHNEFWKTRRRAMHPLHFLWLIIGEFILIGIFGESAETNVLAGTVCSIALLAILVQIPWAIVSLILWKTFIRRNLPKGTKIKNAIRLRKAGKQEVASNKPVRVSPTPVSSTADRPHENKISAPVSKNNAFAGTRAQVRQQKKKAAPKIAMPKVNFSMPQSYSSAQAKNYGHPLESRKAELERLMALDPQN